MFGIENLLSLPLLGGKVVSKMLTSLAAIIPTTENIPNLTESLRNADTPFDLLIDYVNFWARFTGIDVLNIDRSGGILITWEEMNAVWMEVMKILKKSTSLPVALIEAVWVAIANLVPDSDRL